MSTTEVRRITSTADLVAYAPHLIGFTPQPGAAIVAALDGLRLICAAHLRPEIARDPDATTQALDTITRAGADAVVIVAYGLDHVAAAEVSGTLHGAADLAGITVKDAATVAGDTWRSALCTNPDCCPLDGQRIEQTPAAVAAAVVAGSAPAPSRDALTAELDHDPARGGGIPHPLTSTLDRSDPTARDRWMIDGCRAGDLTARAERARTCARSLPTEHPSRPEVLASCAALAYLAGDGARANVALERIAIDRPGLALPTLAATIDGLTAAGADPATMRASLTTLDL